MARPGQDLRVGDVWPDIAGRSDVLAGRAFDAQGLAGRASRPRDAADVAARLEQPSDLTDAPATTGLRDVSHDAVLAAVRVAGVSGLAETLGPRLRPPAYAAVRHDAGWHYGPVAATEMPAFLAGLGTLDAVRHDRLAAAGGARAAASGDPAFRAEWRRLAREGAFQRLVDLFTVTRELSR